MWHFIMLSFVVRINTLRKQRFYRCMVYIKAKALRRVSEVGMHQFHLSSPNTNTDTTALILTNTETNLILKQYQFNIL